jgi:hypothetical protein
MYGGGSGRRRHGDDGRRRRSSSSSSPEHGRKKSRRSGSPASREAPRASRQHQQTDFERFRAKLAKIFFRETDLVQQGTDEYRDFWKFLRQYQALEQSRSKAGKASGDRRLLLQQSFSLLPSDPKDLLNRIPFQDADGGDRASLLTEDMVLEFQYILTLYVDFLQREKFHKLKKLRESQANLPIAEYRNEILRKVKENQVVIVAGDTGCGKSTQVPQYLLQEGYTNIACTQPRRIACISLVR